MDANEVINYSPADAAKRLQQVFIGRKLFRHPKKEVEKLKVDLPVNTKDCPTNVNITLNIVFSEKQS